MAQTPNLGEAIGLQYKMPNSDKAVDILNQRRKEEDDAIKAARIAQSKKLEEIDKYKDDLGKYSVEGIIAPLQVPVQASVSALHDAMKEAGENIRNSDKVKAAKFELDKTLADARIQSNSYLDQTNRGINNPDLYDLDSDFTNAAGKGGIDGYNEWIAANNKIHSGSTSGTNKYTHGVLKPKEQLKQVDWRKSLFNYSNQAGKVKTEDGAEFVPEATKKKLFEGWKNTPDYQAALAEYGTQIPLDKVDSMIYEQDWKPLFSATSAPIKGKGLTMNFGGNSAENDNVRVVVSDTDDKRIYNIAQIKSTENSILDFSQPKNSKGETPTVKGTPLRVEKMKDSGQANIVVSVPEIIDDEKTGNYKEVRVPYEQNKDRVLKGKFGFTIEDIDNGISQNKIEVSKGTKKVTTKSIKRSDISTKAKAAGYSIKEYEKLLTEKGVEIIE